MMVLRQAQRTVRLQQTVQMTTMILMMKLQQAVLRWALISPPCRELNSVFGRVQLKKGSMSQGGAKLAHRVLTPDAVLHGAERGFFSRSIKA